MPRLAARAGLERPVLIRALRAPLSRCAIGPARSRMPAPTVMWRGRGAILAAARPDGLSLVRDVNTRYVPLFSAAMLPPPEEAAGGVPARVVRRCAMCDEMGKLARFLTGCPASAAG